MRLFAAVELERDAVRALEQEVALLRESAAAAKLRWLDPASWHLTLQFFGEVNEASVPALARACDAAAEGGSPFELRLAGLGAFPGAERARVLWLGLQVGAPALEALARALWAQTLELGFQPEARAYRPHLTLARARRPVPAGELLRSAEPPSVATTVRALALFRSHLGSAGARYEPLHRVQLAG